jgi:4-amino-4-deoxy-L-arabinose transferase-like glycosyltransferase
MFYKAEQNTYRIFVSVFIGSLIFKLLISGLIPITGDEALFYVWSQDLSWGYYDHPPMIAWMLASLSWFSSQLVVVRLPASILNHLVALGIINLVIHWQPEKKISAYKVGIVYLLLPSSILSVLVTNDSALFLFVALASYFFIRGEIEEKNGINSKSKFVPLNYVACGAFLGMAFLSKYLAIFIAVSFFVILLYLWSM